MFVPYEGAGRIYIVVCGQEIQRDGGIGTVELLQARCTAEILRLLKREKRGRRCRCV